ncbi:hypothetical protein REC12_19700 [Desulfosporosinus sp. PR]|uniref:hypothetical protein n=1 Tax=Candidatus Desulfosporosinus nitrosoreducens TaxID=3401928 RepID=UPI0027EB1A35|nr:hypothetical protein [Desulfosporosinus sp. PR]MDQ7095821.1 hypothetical protein [Desulfosporosinus sp. PR]
MPKKQWRDFFLYLGRVFLLLIILAVLLPRLAAVCNIWISSLLHDDHKPMGNPMRVEAPDWTKSVLQLFPVSRKE